MPQCLLSSDPTPSSRHMRVLVVEDSYLAARSLARMLQDLGAEVVGPAPSVQAAMSLIESKGCDAAVLDINLGSETVEPIARRLDDEGRPYFFISGYASPKTMLADPRFASRRPRMLLPHGLPTSCACSSSACPSRLPFQCPYHISRNRNISEALERPQCHLRVKNPEAQPPDPSVCIVPVCDEERVSLEYETNRNVKQVDAVDLSAGSDDS